MKLIDFSEQRKNIFAVHGKKESDVENDIQILRDWMLKVPHLPSDFIQDNFLELCLLKNKFSIEKCKKKIETYCTLKADPHYDYIYRRIPVPTKEASFFTPLPMLTDDYKRIIMYKVYNEKSFDMAEDLGFNVLLREFLLRYDYNDGEVQILDLRDISTSIMSKFRLNICADSTTLLLNGFSARISALHVVSKVGKTLFSLIIPLLPKKLVARIHFHEDEISLSKAIPAKYLPSDYGGSQKSLEEIRADWNEIFENNRKILEAFMDVKSREELRQDDGSSVKEMQGTFKKLCID